MPLIQYMDHYVYDKGLNLTNIHHNDFSQVQEVVSSSNKLSQFNYDNAGNQLETENLDKLAFNCQGQIASAQKITGGQTVNEYYTYATEGHRVKKVTKTIMEDYVIGIDIVLYVEDTEYRARYTGTDLLYDGEAVKTNSGSVMTVQDNVETRIKSGHGQVAKITRDEQVQDTSYSYNLINNIDSNSVEMSSESNMISHQGYYPYGKEASTQGNKENKQLGYSGQERDSTLLNDYGFRYYNSKSGRWTQADPIGFKSGQLNMYAMVKGNPVSLKDERGLAYFDLLVSGYLRRNNIFKHHIPLAVTACVFLYYGKEQSVSKDIFDLLQLSNKVIDRVNEIFRYGTANLRSYFDKDKTVIYRHFLIHDRKVREAFKMKSFINLIGEHYEIVKSMHLSYSLETAICDDYAFWCHLLLTEELKKANMENVNIYQMMMREPIVHKFVVITKKDLVFDEVDYSPSDLYYNEKEDYYNQLIVVDAWTRDGKATLMDHYELSPSSVPMGPIHALTDTFTIQQFALGRLKDIDAFEAPLTHIRSQLRGFGDEFFKSSSDSLLKKSDPKKLHELIFKYTNVSKYPREYSTTKQSHQDKEKSKGMSKNLFYKKK